MVVSDIVLDGELPAVVREDVEAYVGCIAGAMRREPYFAAIEAAGFAPAELLKDVDYVATLGEDAGDDLPHALLAGLEGPLEDGGVQHVSEVHGWWTCPPPLASLSSLVPPPTLLDRRLVIVTGKGGVGKTTVCAALALLAARAGKRVLVCEVNARARVAALLGGPPAGPVIREVRPGISVINVTPPEAMREYGLMVLRFRTIYDAVFENRLVRYFLRVIPSLAEVVMLGKILHEARAEEAGRPRWDLVLVDAPATGHAVQLLRVPSC